MIWALSYDIINGKQKLVNSLKKNYLGSGINLPESYSLDLRNYPNPFNANTIFDFNITISSEVNLKIFDIKGNLVRQLINDRMEVGLKTIKWDSTNDKGEDIAAGLYLYQLIVNEQLFSNKMIYLK
jgi:hypothetical protein